jgi:two-component system, chemotaxis family, CheB/CheR fusion protein
VVFLAHSLTAAEQIVCTESLDILLSDLQLVGESGLEAPRRMADAARGCGRSASPAIVLSGFARENDIAQTRAAGFAAHLVKPVNEQALLHALRHAVAVGYGA